jgi:uncharacterized protein (DUF4415 family)
MTLDEARALSASGKTGTDWKRLRAMTEAEIEANAASDPDNPPWTAEMLAKAQRIDPRRQAVSIRLDRDVVEFLKSEGPGYQSRINAILRTYVDARKAG